MPFIPIPINFGGGGRLDPEAINTLTGTFILLNIIFVIVNIVSYLRADAGHYESFTDWFYDDDKQFVRGVILNGCMTMLDVIVVLMYLGSLIGKLL